MIFKKLIIIILYTQYINTERPGDDSKIFLPYCAFIYIFYTMLL